MKEHNPEQLRERTQQLIDAQKEGARRNDWTFFVPDLYSTDCVYTCEYAGTMLVRAVGLEEIMSTHYGRDMEHGWEGWEFPYCGIYIGEQNRVVTHWLNRGPGKRPDGSHYETPGVSFIRWNDELKICEQLDLFDLCHQVRLCEELDAVGLLSADLKDGWVEPTRRRLIETLGGRC